MVGKCLLLYVVEIWQAKVHGHKIEHADFPNIAFDELRRHKDLTAKE